MDNKNRIRKSKRKDWNQRKWAWKVRKEVGAVKKSGKENQKANEPWRKKKAKTIDW